MIHWAARWSFSNPTAEEALVMDYRFLKLGHRRCEVSFGT